MKRPMILAASALALAGCSGGQWQTFNTREAGADLDAGYFGNSTMNNTLVQTGASSYTVNLNNRFSAEVNPMVNFAFDSAVLDAQAQTVLRQQADWIRQFPEVRFRVYGHTDLVGSETYNRQLGMRRAQAVVSYLVAQGISRDRLEAVVSYGETQPLIVTEGRERQNRRTVTEVSGFVEAHPNVLNGKYAEVIFREYITSAEVPATLESGGGGGSIAEAMSGG